MGHEPITGGSPDEREVVGVVGLGALGSAMAFRLRDAGHRVVGFDVAEERCALAAERIEVVSSPSAVAELADRVVLSVVRDAEQTSLALFGDDGIAGAGRELVVAVASTVGPAPLHALGTRADGTSITLLDAPVSGGVARARNGTLTTMVAGGDDAIATARAALSTVSSTVVELGTRLGSAQVVKLVNQMSMAAGLLAARDAMQLAEAHGLDREAVRAVLGASTGRSWSFEDGWPSLESLLDGRPARELEILAKDVRAALEATRTAGLDDIPAAALLREFTA